MPAKLKLTRSRLEDQLYEQIKLAGLPEPIREHRFAPPRKWRFDFCWHLWKPIIGQPNRKIRLAVEVEGVTRYGKHLGRHQSHKGFAADCEKYNAAALAGWVVLRFTDDAIRSGEALKLIEEALR